MDRFARICPGRFPVDRSLSGVTGIDGAWMPFHLVCGLILFSVAPAKAVDDFECFVSGIACPSRIGIVAPATPAHAVQRVFHGYERLEVLNCQIGGKGNRGSMQAKSGN